MTIYERPGREETLLTNDSGQGLVEYAIIIALIAVVCLIGVHGLGNATRSQYNNISTATNTIGN